VKPVRKISVLLGGAVTLLSSLLALYGTSSHAQEATASGVITLTRIDEDVAGIELDGYLNEAVWQGLPSFDGMRVINPDTLAPAPLRTDTRIFYNDRGIYVGVMNYQDPDTLIARMSSRDDGVLRDGFVIAIDASGGGLWGYYLRVNLGGTLSDGTILPEKQISRDWDGSWDAVTRELDNGWSTEIFIPWNMMALPQSGETRQIGIYTERQFAAGNETWSWPALPGTNPQYLSAFQKFEVSGINPRTQFTFYPYASVTRDNISGENTARTGADVYWRPNSNTQLSATINPDFGTVESDDIVVNLSAFETFFSEKRTFFVEGQDVFVATPRSRGGPFGPTTVLNTRRIGAAPGFTVPPGVQTRVTDRNTPTELLGAVKLTGSQGNWRYGTLLASEDDTAIRGTTADGSRVRVQATGRDFAVGRLLYESTSGGGRRGFGWIGTRLQHADREATVNGVDFSYFSADTRWVFDGQALHSNVDGESGKGMYFDLNYRPARGVQHTVSGTFFDRKLDINDVGFVQRNDHLVLDYRYNLTESGLERYRNRNTTLQVVNQWNNDGRPVRLGLFASQNLSFHDNTSLNLGFRYFPPRVDDRLSRGNGTFKIPHRIAYNANWNSDRSRPVSFGVGFGNSQEDQRRSNIQYNAGVSWQPNDRFSTGAMVGYRDRESWLVHRGGNRLTAFRATEWSPQWDASYFISAKQQFRMSVQWTGIKAKEDKFYQIDQNNVRHLVRTNKPNLTPDDFTVSRMSFQARYRWEIAPLSDLFIVYTRGSNLPSDVGAEFQDLLFDAWSERVTDTWVVKLRYRLGS
jgi:hypothetical protein